MCNRWVWEGGEAGSGWLVGNDHCDVIRLASYLTSDCRGHSPVTYLYKYPETRKTFISHFQAGEMRTFTAALLLCGLALAHGKTTGWCN